MSDPVTPRTPRTEAGQNFLRDMAAIWPCIHNGIPEDECWRTIGVQRIEDQSLPSVADLAAVARLAEDMRGVFECHCDEIWTGRGLHEPACLWDEGGEEMLSALAATGTQP